MRKALPISAQARFINTVLGLFIYTFIAFTAVSRTEANEPLISPISLPLDRITLKPPAPITVIEAQEPGCRIADTFTAEVKRWEKDICRWSEEYQMDPDLIATIMQIESCGNHQAVSFTGVKGLFQVTGANLAGENGFSPESSMRHGPAKVLKNEIAAAEGNIRAAMAGYNGGAWARDYISGKLTRAQFIARLRSHGSGRWRALSTALAKANEVERYAQWANIYFESKSSERTTLDTWLNIGGARLCTVAANTPQLALDEQPAAVTASDIETKSP